MILRKDSLMYTTKWGKVEANRRFLCLHGFSIQIDRPPLALLSLLETILGYLR